MRMDNSVETRCRESDGILVYLIDKYDMEHKISVAETGDKSHQLQWLFFQASGQG
ncbi:hypothetical protein OH76DRAFT_1399152 [Lentinus brumalis]|uniref:Uncharacterized protein n=1 Tax=Lentinus brumalis TaxID=2498619 RepID=A0A371DL66_9APHY|nr:hypothetical protein OH76DRAFT_1399152 [Polyporus brumalis]